MTRLDRSRRNRTSPTRIAWTLILLSAAALSAEEPPPIDRPLTNDALERQLELARHARLAQIKANPENRLAEFTTDGCSGGLSAGWELLATWLPGFRAVHGERPPWESCCVDHDRLYHAGGRRDATADESFEARRAADLDLRACVIGKGTQRASELREHYGLTEAESAGLYDAVADLMYRSVRLGGIPCSELPWRWGYGWPRCN